MYDNRDLNLMDVIIFKCLIMYVMKIFSNPHFWAWDFECLVSKFQQDITQEFSQLPQFYLWQKKLPNISIFTSGTKKASLFLWSNCPYPWQSAIDRYRWTARGLALVDTTVFPSAATAAAAAATALSAVIHDSSFISVPSVQLTTKADSGLVLMDSLDPGTYQSCFHCRGWQGEKLPDSTNGSVVFVHHRPNLGCV